jgi:hypothetical protein
MNDKFCSMYVISKAKEKKANNSPLEAHPNQGPKWRERERENR